MVKNLRYIIILLILFSLPACWLSLSENKKNSNTLSELTCPEYPINDAQGAVYYVCDCDNSADSDCQPGDDDNDGLSVDSPFKSFEKARTQFGTIAAGDMVAFCRGGSFSIDEYGETRWVNSNCSAENPCIVRDYEPDWGSGDEGKPIITAIEGSDAIRFDDSGTPEHEEGYVFLNLELRGSGSGSAFTFYNDIDNVVICNTTIDFFGLGVHVGGANALDPDNTDPRIDQKNDNISLLKSTIINNSGQGFLGGCDNCTLEGNYFENNGYGEAIYNHNIYLSGSSDDVANNMRVVGNELYRSSFIDYECKGVSLVVHGQVDGLLIENNIIREDINGAGGGCWGIAVDTGYSSAEEFRKVEIRGNAIVNLGGLSIGLNACQDCVIEDNLIVNEQDDYHVGIAVTDRERAADDLAMERITVRNNSVYIGEDAFGTGIRLQGEGTGHISTYNDVFYAGSGSFSCYSYGLPSESYNEVNNNTCYSPNTAVVTWEATSGNDLLIWQESSSLDTGSYIADPDFQSTSHPIHSYIGITPEVTIPPDVTPDIPAYVDLTTDTSLSTPAVCPSFPISSAVGTVYYICDCDISADGDCVEGDDNNDGTSVITPWQTYEKARTQFTSMLASDMIAFCRGGAFRVDEAADTRWVNYNCRSGTPCVIQDYDPNWASGDEGKPVIIVDDGNEVFRLDNSGYAEHQEGYVFLNLDVRGSGSGTGFFVSNDIDDVMVCNVDIDSLNLGFYVAGANDVNPDNTDPSNDGRNEKISLVNSTVTNNSGQGYLGGCDSCTIEGNYFGNNGFGQAVFNHNIYLSGSSGEINDNMRVIGNELYQSAMVEGECRGVSMVVHGKFNNLLIEDNIVHEDIDAAGGGCWGIAIDTGYGSAEKFWNVKILRNKVINVGNMSIGINACQDCIIENNVIINEQSAFSQSAIYAPDRNRGIPDLQMERVTVRNNSIYMGADTRGYGIRLGGEGNGHRSVSNVIYYAGEDSFSCFSYDLWSMLYFEVDNNICYFPNTTSGNWEYTIGDLATWLAYSGLDGNSQVSDPSFVSVTSPNYDLSTSNAASPMIDKGHAYISSPYTIDGITRDTLDGSPDIGAYEF